MFLRHVLHNFSEGTQWDWAQVALNCNLLVNLFYHGFSPSLLAELPGATSQINDLHPRLCFRVCFRRTQTETIFWIISFWNLKRQLLCSGSWLVPIHTAAWGRLELGRPWQWVCPGEKVRQRREDRPASTIPAIPEGTPPSPSTSETTSRTPGPVDPKYTHRGAEYSY